MTKTIKIAELKLDKNLMYLIQYTTKQKTQDILGYFYELSKDIVDAKTSATHLNKTMLYRYPDTKIPYKINIRSSYLNTDRPVNAYVTVSFPKSNDYWDGSKLVEQLEAAFEGSIGLTEAQDMPDFQEPVVKIPMSVRKKRGIAYERKAKVSTEPVSASGQRTEPTS